MARGKVYHGYNNNFQTNYLAEKASRQNDSADAYLCSKNPELRIGMQLTRVLSIEQKREEGIQSKLQEIISKKLVVQGITNCLINIVSQKIPQKNDINLWPSKVVELVSTHFPKPHEKIVVDNTENPFVFGDLPFVSLSIYKNLPSEIGKGGNIFRFLMVKDVLPAEQIIQEAIDKKVKRNYQDSRELWLILYPDAGGYTIDVSELKEINFRNLDKFSQVWWVYPQRDITEIYQLIAELKA